MKIVFCLALLVACAHQGESKTAPVLVKTITVQRQTIPADFEYVGVAESSHIVEMRARVEGYLEEIDYVEGGLVEAGQLMFVLDERPFIADVERARGLLEQREALWWNAQQTKNRMIPLYAEDAVSQRDYDLAIADELAAFANLQSAQAELYKAEVDLSYARIRSPVKALSSRAVYRTGALIAPNANLLTTLYVIDPIWINFNISDLDILKFEKQVQLGYIRPPKNSDYLVEAVLADGTVLPAEGKINFLNPAVEPETGTLLVRSVFPNHSGRLLPGQFVKVIVKGSTYPDAIVVPQTAVIQGQGGMFVFVVHEGTVSFRPVQVGDWYGSDWIIQEGLNEGDVVVTEGINKLKNGMAVTSS